MNLDDLGPSELILWIFCIRILLSLDYLFFWVPKDFTLPIISSLTREKCENYYSLYWWKLLISL